MFIYLSNQACQAFFWTPEEEGFFIQWVSHSDGIDPDSFVPWPSPHSQKVVQPSDCGGHALGYRHLAPLETFQEIFETISFFHLIFI